FQPRILNLFFDDGTEARLDLQAGQCLLQHCARPDLADSAGKRLAQPPPAGKGLVLWVPHEVLQGRQPMASLNDQVALLEPVPLLSPDALLAHQGLLLAYGGVLQALANTQREQGLAGKLAESLARLREQRSGQLLGQVE